MIREANPNRISEAYDHFSRSEWARLRASTPLTLTDEELERLRGTNDYVSLDEVRDIYLPLSRLLNLCVGAAQGLHVVADLFLGKPARPVPYIIGVAGSVAVGKSTFSRILRALLSRWPNHPRVDLITTDGFLYPNRVLEKRGLMQRKGFPESYDLRSLISMLSAIKSGASKVEIPKYSHIIYDILPEKRALLHHPDIVILEGLNVLQTAQGSSRSDIRTFVSDFFDFSIYLDAPETAIEEWYVQRFFTFQHTAFRDPQSYFHRFASLSDEEASQTAHKIWQEINGPNLRQNIEPTRQRARLILRKDADHSIQEILLRHI